jgi:hypothetical protein
MRKEHGRAKTKVRFGATPKPDTRDAYAQKFMQRNLVAKNELVYRDTKREARAIMRGQSFGQRFANDT